MRHQQLDGQQNRAYREGWAPLFLLEDVKTYTAQLVDVRMVDFRPEKDFRWLHWVGFWKVDFKMEGTALIDSTNCTFNRSVEVPEVRRVD